MNTRVASCSLVAACSFVSVAVGLHADSADSPARPINFIINKAPRGGTIPDPDPVIIGEFGDNIIFTAKVSATVRKLFYKSVITKDRSGIDVNLHYDTIATKKYPIKASRVVKGEIDNYCYEEDSVNEKNGVAFFHEKGNGIYRASSTSKSSKILFLKKTDTDKTGQDPTKMASGLSILDWAGKFPLSSESVKTYQFPFLLFAAPDKKKGKELWLSDGSAAGTKVFADINPTTTDTPGPRNKTIKVPNGSDISPISTYFGDNPETGGAQAYFSAFNGTDYHIYSVASLLNVAKGHPRVVLTDLFDIVVKPSQLSATPLGVFFAAPTSATNNEELWGYDPKNNSIDVLSTNTGTILPQNAEFRSGFPNGDYNGFFFSGITGSEGREPQVASFDTGTGTSIIDSLGDLATGATGSNPRNFTQIGHLVYFVANPGDGEHLYRSNANAGDHLDLGRFDNIHDIVSLVDEPDSNNELGKLGYFVANDNTNTPVLWRVSIDPSDDPAPTKVLTGEGFPVKNPTSLHRLVGNGIYYVFFVCDGAGTEFENIVPTKGSPFPAQHQVWYTGRVLN
jgi:ELWxxDGT repeat protein